MKFSSARAMLFERLFDEGHGLYDFFTNSGDWHNHILQLADLYVDQDHSLRVLDVGCGPGVSTFVTAARLPTGSHIVGVDQAAKMIGRARQHLRGHASSTAVEFLCCSAAELPFDEGHFDVIIANSFLYLLAEPAAVLQECRRTLKKGGRVGMIEPNQEVDFRDLTGYVAKHINRSARNRARQLQYLMTVFGWRVVSSMHERQTAASLTRQFETSGFAVLGCTPVLDGLGLKILAEKV